jgi:hypothetical protein
MMNSWFTHQESMAARSAQCDAASSLPPMDAKLQVAAVLAFKRGNA